MGLVWSRKHFILSVDFHNLWTSTNVRGSFLLNLVQKQASRGEFQSDSIVEISQVKEIHEPRRRRTVGRVTFLCITFFT